MERSDPAASAWTLQDLRADRTTVLAAVRCQAVALLYAAPELQARRGEGRRQREREQESEKAV